LLETAQGSAARRATAHQAELALRRGDPAGAALLARQTRDALDRLGMSEHPSAIEARRTLGQALVALGEHDAAAHELRNGLASAQRQFVSGDDRILKIRRALASTQKQTHK